MIFKITRQAKIASKISKEIPKYITPPIHLAHFVSTRSAGTRCTNYFFPFSIFAQVSAKVTVRLKIGLPGIESLVSTQK